MTCHPQSAAQQRINAARHTNTPATLSQSHGHPFCSTSGGLSKKNRRKWSANSIGGGTYLRGRNLKSVGDNGSILIQCDQEFAGEVGNVVGGTLLRIPIAIPVKHVSDSRYPSH